MILVSFSALWFVDFPEGYEAKQSVKMYLKSDKFCAPCEIRDEQVGENNFFCYAPK